MCRALRSTAAIALTCGHSLTMWWVPPEIGVADKPSQRGLRPFTKNRPHHPAAPRQRHVPETRLAHGAPARGASQNHQWNQIVSPPSCGHRRSGAQRRGIARAATKHNASGKEEEESRRPATSLCVHRSRKDGPGVGVRRPNDHERLRAVAAPTRVPDAGDLRLRTPNSTNINVGARHSNNPPLGEGRGRVGRHGRKLRQRSILKGSHSSLGARLASALAWAGKNQRQHCYPCFFVFAHFS